MMTDYKLVCIDGETEGEEREVYSGDFAAVAKFLRLQLEWERFQLEWDLAVAEKVLEGDVTQCQRHMERHMDQSQPLYEEFTSARFELLGRGVFENKSQFRSTWALIQNEEQAA